MLNYTIWAIIGLCIILFIIGLIREGQGHDSGQFIVIIGLLAWIGWITWLVGHFAEGSVGLAVYLCG